MTRIIKFRAWDGKKMIDTGMIHDTNFGDGCRMWDGDKHEYLELMQFTGLYDKNGKEIYEGDIVGMPVAGISKVGAIFGHHYSWVDKVVWNENTASFQISQRMDGQYGLTTYLPPYNGVCFEIIGNIYENPTLLNQ